MKLVKGGLFSAVFHISVIPPSTSRFYFFPHYLFCFSCHSHRRRRRIVSIGSKVTEVKVLIQFI